LASVPGGFSPAPAPASLPPPGCFTNDFKVGTKKVVSVIKRKICGGTSGEERIYRLFVRLDDKSEQWITLDLRDGYNLKQNPDNVPHTKDMKL
jgi:hypothetical protein